MGISVGGLSGRRFRWTEARRARVIEVLRESGNASAAAAAVGARWSSLNWLRKKDPEFGAQCEAASREADERLQGPVGGDHLVPAVSHPHSPAGRRAAGVDVPVGELR